MGDLNAEPEDVHAIKVLLEQHHWIDVGSCASCWGSPDCQATCITKGANQPNRRDFVFASPEAFGLIKSYKVVGEDLCPTHATLSFVVDLKEAEYSTYRARKLQSLGSLAIEACHLVHRLPPTPLDESLILEQPFDGPAVKSEAIDPMVKQLVG